MSSTGLNIFTSGPKRFVEVTPQLLQLLEDAKYCLLGRAQHPAFAQEDQSRYLAQYQKLRGLLKDLA